MINIILATSLNLTTGVLGQIALGHAGFMSVGAYAAAIFSMKIAEAAKLVEKGAPTAAGFGTFLASLVAVSYTHLLHLTDIDSLNAAAEDLGQRCAGIERKSQDACDLRAHADIKRARHTEIDKKCEHHDRNAAHDINIRLRNKFQHTAV